MPQLRLIREDYAFQDDKTSVCLEVLHERAMNGKFGRNWSFHAPNGSSVVMEPCSPEQVTMYEAEFSKLCSSKETTPAKPSAVEAAAKLNAALANLDEALEAIDDPESPAYYRARKAKLWIVDTLEVTA